MKPHRVIATDARGLPIFADDRRDDDWRELDRRARIELDKRLAKLGIRPRSTRSDQGSAGASRGHLLRGLGR